MPQSQSVEREINITSAEILNYREPHAGGPLFNRQQPPYVPTSWEQYLDVLQELCHSRNMLVAVTGQEGIGKTTLMQQFIEIMHEESTIRVQTLTLPHSKAYVHTSHVVRTCQLFADSHLTPTMLIACLTKAFDLPLSSAEDSLDEQLDAQIANIQQSAYDCILIIDNAENLSAEVLSKLIYLISQQSEAQMRLHVFLFGGQSLQNSLQVFMQDEFNAGYLFLLPLSPLNLDETKRFLQHIAKNISAGETRALTGTIMEAIYKLSEGNPGKINEIAPRFLFSDRTKNVGGVATKRFGELHTKLIGGSLIFITVLLATFVLNKNSHINEVLPFNLNKLFGNAQTKVVALEPPEPAPTVVETAPPVVEAVTPAEEIIAPPPAPEIVEAPPAPAPVIAAAPPAKVIVAAKPLPSPFNPQHYTHDETTLLNLPANHYCLQFSAMHDAVSLQKIIAHQHLVKNAYIYRTFKLNQNWQILVYGDYTSRQDAQDALTNLPSGLQKLKPWVRKISTVQQEIKK